MMWQKLSDREVFKVKKGAQDLHLDSPATLQLRYVYHSNKQKQ